MNYKVLTVIIVFFFSSCDKISKKNTSLYDLIPENSEFVISIKNLSKFKSSVTNNDYLNTVINSNLTVTPIPMNSLKGWQSHWQSHLEFFLKMLLRQAQQKY